MGIYDAFKDALNVAQKADNVELYRKLLDLSAQALDLQAENARLKRMLGPKYHLNYGDFFRSKIPYSP